MREKPMATKDVCEFSRTDGETPSMNPWGAGIRTPLDVMIHPGMPFKLRCGISFSRGGLAFIDPGIEQMGVRLLSSPVWVAPNEEVVLDVVNTQPEATVRFLAKTTVARVVFTDVPELKPAG